MMNKVECPKGKVLNTASNRCVIIGGLIHKLMLEKNDTPELAKTKGEAIANKAFKNLCNNVLRKNKDVLYLRHFKNLNPKYFKTLPAEIGNLTNLKHLNTNGFTFSSVPAEIEKLTKLRTLNMDGSKLTNISQHILNLANLRTLSLANNNITLIPKELTKLKKLSFIDLGGNKIQNLMPKSMSGTKADLNPKKRHIFEYFWEEYQPKV
jgi:hypothetical protein